MQVLPPFNPVSSGILSSNFPMNSTGYFHQSIPTNYFTNSSPSFNGASKLKRKAYDDVDMEESWKPAKAFKIDISEITEDSPSAVTIEEYDTKAPVIEEPVDYVFTEEERRSPLIQESTESANESSGKSQITLYKTPISKIPQELNDRLWDRFVVGDDGSIHLFNKITGEETTLHIKDLAEGQIIRKDDLKPAVILDRHHSENDSEDEEFQGPRIVEITDEEERQILNEKEQNKIQKLEEDLMEMDLD